MPSSNEILQDQNSSSSAGSQTPLGRGSHPRLFRALEKFSMLRGLEAKGSTAIVEKDYQDLETPKSNTENSAEWEKVSVIPTQTWEGYVTSVLLAETRFTADLHDRAGIESVHSAEISFSEIHIDDLDLIKEGAVFYWTFGRVNISRGNAGNFDQIRFRRLPNWSKLRIAEINKSAESLYDFFKEVD